MSTSGSKSNEHVAHFLVDIHNGKKTSMKMIRYYAHSTGSLTMQLYIQLKDKAIEARTLKLLIFRLAR